VLLSFISFPSDALSTYAEVSDGQGQSSCAPLAYNKQQLIEWRADKFELPDGTKANSVALSLTKCLGSPDPFFRDQIGYEGLTRLLRGKALAETEMRSLKAILTEQLEQAPDPGGFRKPFVALVLSEVARTDRVAPYFTDDERQELVDVATGYVASVKDYRGFDQVEGWRHGVAHGADFLMQLALNPALSKGQHIQILGAVAAQVNADGTRAYTHGEPERLARPVLFVAMRGLISDDEWKNWLDIIAAPKPFDTWGAVFSSEKGLVRRHNIKAFLQAVYINASISSQEPVQALKEPALDALRRIP
jgi:hypothetical protein